VVSESRVTWATSLPILVFLGLSVFDLGPMYATDAHHRLMPPTLGAGHNNGTDSYTYYIRLLIYLFNHRTRTRSTMQKRKIK